MFIRNPNSTRPWQHVLEPLSGLYDAFKKLFDNNDFSGSWNFGPSSSDVGSVENIAKGILSHFDNSSIEVDKSQNHHYESNLLQLNCDKSNILLGWYPKWGLTETINNTAIWYKHYINKDDMTKSYFKSD